jgi:16S rRNA (guanine527-N7)-methyltransferase
VSDEDQVSRETADRPFFGIDTTIDRYVDILTSRGVDWGLIGPREASRIWPRHIWNCVVVAPAIKPGARVCDVGSGAGLPGVVLAIARPDLAVTLLEPMARRCTFLAGVVEELALPNVRVVRGRAGDPGGCDSLADHSFDVVTARAVAPMARLVPWCAPLVAPGGVLLALKGASAVTELADATAVLRDAGVRDAQIAYYGHGLATPPTAVARLQF